MPPIILKKKTDKGINTDKIEKQSEIKYIEKEVIKEIKNLKFDLNYLKYDNNNNNFTIHANEKQNKNNKIKNNNNNKKNNILLKKKNSNNNNNNKFSLLKIEKFDNLNLISKVKKPKKIFKLTKNTMTDLTYKNIISLETLNEEYSNQLKTLEKDKNKIKKNYENQIEKLNKQISLFKEKEEDTIKKNYITKNNSFQILNIEKIKNNKEEEKINELNNNNNNNNKNSNTNILNTSSAFLPEMIPPEQTYKIFVHCVKHFKYEEDLYKDYFEEEDILNLKHFVNKMEKYTYHTSIPVQRKDPFHYYKPIESASQKKYKESILMGFKPMTINIRSKSRTNSKTSKNKNKQKSYDYRNNNTSANYSYNIHNFDTTNSTFNKYKAVLRSLKNS